MDILENLDRERERERERENERVQRLLNCIKQRTDSVAIRICTPKQNNLFPVS